MKSQESEGQPLRNAEGVLAADGGTVAYIEALLSLYRIGGAEADRAVMEFIGRMSHVRDKAYDLLAHGTAVRVAAEFDPDRDPSPFMDLLAAPRPKNRIGRFLYERSSYLREMDDLTGGVFGFGYTRLRRLSPSPIERYARRLTGSSRSTVRAYAAEALGDTADLAALDPLAVALDDGHPTVRAAAAGAVRRLRHAGAAAELASHSVEEKLTALLHDPHRATRRNAAQALVLLERGQRVRAVLAAADAQDRPEFEAYLGGFVPPLVQTWPGDMTHV